MTPPTSTRARNRPRDERGSISIWLVTSSFVMMMLVGLAVAGGVDLHAQRVDRAVASGHRRAQAGEVVAHRQAEVAREQVAGAGRQDAERNTGVQQAGRHVAHRAVAAERGDHVDALVDRRPGLTEARVVGRRLQPQRRRPTVATHDLFDVSSKLGHLLDLRRVHDDGGALHSPPRVPVRWGRAVIREATGPLQRLAWPA